MDRKMIRHSDGYNYYERRCYVRASVVILGTAIICILLAYTAFTSSATVTDRVVAATTIRQVTFVFRHGDRTPTETYPKDPHANYDWPNGPGTLTKKGMLEAYELGQWIRKKYGTTIGRKYQSATALILSSYADRCIMSAQALLAALYPPNLDEMFVPGLAWQPIPVHATPRHLDKIIVVKAACPRLENALKEAYENISTTSSAGMAIYYEELSKYTGQNVSTITDVEFLYNTLEIEEQNGLELPEWTKKFYNAEMREIAARSLGIFTSNTLQRRLRGGPLLKEILQNMNNVLTTNERKGKNKSKSKKLYLYSAHDITLVNLLRTMGFTNELFKPDYAATLIFELRTIESTDTDVSGNNSNSNDNDPNDLAVKLFYRNNTGIEDAHPMKIPRCTEPCSLRTLLEILKNVIPDDWDAECLSP